MAEYIDRVVAIAALTEFRDDQTVFKYATASDFLSARDAIERAIKVLESLPAADVEPVVRCRECKYHNKPPCPMRLSFNWTEDDDFCSYGERKEGAD